MKKILIISSKVKNVSAESFDVVLTEKDFNPLCSFFEKHPDIIPESIDYIYVKGIFENSPIMRCVLKNIYWMLSINGILEIDFLHMRLGGYGFAIRPEDDLAYEISCVTYGNLLLEDYQTGKVSKRKYRKIRASLAENDNINSWTFGIVSDGRKNNRILQIIKRISDLEIPKYEIIICGPSPSDILPDNVTVINDSSFYKDKRIPLCKKKNAIITAAKYENLVVIHDRIMISIHWFDQILKHGNYFDAIIPEILDEETESKHIVDCPIYKEKTFGKHYKREYGVKWSEKLYMDGAIMIIKKTVAMNNLLREYLHWGEKEDVDFSKRLYLNGAFIELNHSIKTTSMTYKRKGGNDPSLFKQLLKRPFSYPKWLFNYSKEKYLLYKYIYNM